MQGCALLTVNMSGIVNQTDKTQVFNEIYPEEKIEKVYTATNTNNKIPIPRVLTRHQLHQYICNSFMHIHE